jgi:Zn-dependent protease with chaperone function
MPVVIALLCGLAIHLVLCGWVLDRRLAAARWVTRAPTTALLLWQALGFATVASAFAASLLLAHDALEHTLLWLLQVDKGQLHVAYAGDRQVPFAWNLTLAAGFLALVTLIGRVVWSCWLAERKRSAHRLLDGEMLDRTKTEAVMSVTGDTAFAYCLPRRRLPYREARVVISEAAQDRLRAEELAAAIAHERAHLAGQHHRLVTVANAVAAMTSRLGLLVNWGEQTSRLVELTADDRAARTCGRSTVARALLTMATPDPAASPSSGHGHSGVLAVGASDMSERIRRLMPASARPGPERPLGVMASLVLASAPVVAVMLPAVTVAFEAGPR